MSSMKRTDVFVRVFIKTNKIKISVRLYTVVAMMLFSGIEVRSLNNAFCGYLDGVGCFFVLARMI